MRTGREGSTHVATMIGALPFLFVVTGLLFEFGSVVGAAWVALLPVSLGSSASLERGGLERWSPTHHTEPL